MAYSVEAIRFMGPNGIREGLRQLSDAATLSLRATAISSPDGSSLTVCAISEGRFYVHLYDDRTGLAWVALEENGLASKTEQVSQLMIHLKGSCRLSLEAAVSFIDWFAAGADLNASSASWVGEVDAEVAPIVDAPGE